MTLLSLLLASASAFLVGLSKTGLPGVSILGIVLMTEAYPNDALHSVAAILPILLAGDVFAVAWFRRHADWGRLVRLLPWVVAGMIPGVFVLLWFIMAMACGPSSACWYWECSRSKSADSGSAGSGCRIDGGSQRRPVLWPASLRSLPTPPCR